MNNGTATIPSSAGGVMARVSPCVINPFGLKTSHDKQHNMSTVMAALGLCLCVVLLLYRIRLKCAPYIICSLDFG